METTFAIQIPSVYIVFPDYANKIPAAFVTKSEKFLSGHFSLTIGCSTSKRASLI